MKNVCWGLRILKSYNDWNLQDVVGAGCCLHFGGYCWGGQSSCGMACLGVGSLFSLPGTELVAVVFVRVSEVWDWDKM